MALNSMHSKQFYGTGLNGDSWYIRSVIDHINDNNNQS